MKKWEKFTKEELEKFVKDSQSYAQVGKLIGYAMRGGSGVKTIKEMIEHYQFDTEHFTGQGWNKDNFDYSRFKNDQIIKVASALPAIVALRGHKCEICKNDVWNNQPIPLEIHHLNGQSLDNELENLQLCCPNCHAQTENWRGKNISQGVEKVSEEDFVEALKSKPNIRQALLSLGLSAKGGNYTRARELIHKYDIEHLL